MKIIFKRVSGILLISILFLFPVKAQVSKSKGDKLYNKMAYSDAIAGYEKILKRHPENTEVLINLAQCYRLTNEHIMLEQTYARMMKIPNIQVQQKYNYALSLIANGKYDEGKIWMQQFEDETKDERARDYLNSLNNLSEFYKDSSSYKIEKLAINSLNADFSPAIYKDGIVFASARKQTGLLTREHSWTGEAFLSLYYSKGSEGDFRTPEAFSSDIKSKFNDGPVSFNQSGEKVYLTRNNVENGKTKKSTDKVVKLKIFEAVNSNGSWRKITNFPYNSDQYNCGHPSISPDENQLYFASDMPGGFGGMDLYVCEKENGKWAKPENLGKEINTSGNDIFPYVHEDGTLFFASDGHNGMGGLDIYSSKKEDKEFKKIKNMGAPINSNDDDFALVFNSKSKEGYFSSNRANRGMDDDIYSFSRVLTLKGIVVDINTGKSIESATVILSNPITGNNEITTLDDGKFSFPVDFDQEYTINGTKINMGEDHDSLNTNGMSPADEPFVKLELGLRQPLFTLHVNVLDTDSRMPIELAALKLNDSKSLLGNTDTAGIYKQDLASNSKMYVLVTKPGYNSKIISVTNEGLTASKDFVYNVELKKGKDLAGFEEWNKIIYYNLDKYNIRARDAVPTLEEVLDFLKSHPEVIIKLSAHTDSRASKAYNMLLSERRAIAAKNFLVDHGANAYQIAALEWSGESIFVNQCGDGVYCPEKDHQLNRRTEITVKDINRKKKKN